MSCNGATQSQHTKECQTLAPGSPPYMVSVNSGFRPAHLRTLIVIVKITKSHPGFIVQVKLKGNIIIIYIFLKQKYSPVFLTGGFLVEGGSVGFGSTVISSEMT